MLKQLKETLAGKFVGIQGQENYFCSSVLLPLVETEDGLAVIFEVRSSHLRRQPGEICFPGGKIEPEEVTNPQKTALRETEEELGIPVEQIEILGPLDILVTPSEVIVYPYVGLIKEYNPNSFSADEVEKLICVPLKFFLEQPPEKSSLEYKVIPGDNFPLELIPSSYLERWEKTISSYPVYFYHLPDGSLLWGITALILFNFLKLYKKFLFI